jgi:type IV pilus assembly protein PilQ
MMMFLIVWGISCLVQGQFDFTSLLEGRMALAEEVESMDKPSYIKGIELTEQEKDSIVTIKASKPLTYTVIKLKEPLKIVVDIPEFTVEPAIEPVKVNSEVISEIINKQLEKGERKFSRIEISLNRDVNYDVTTKLSDLIIRIAKPVKIVEKDEKVVEGIGSKQVEDLPERDKGKKVVDLEINKDLDGMTVITDSAIIKYNAFLLENPYRLVVDIPGVKHLLPKNIFSFESSFVTELKIGQHPEKVRLVVYFQDKLPGYKIEKDKNKLFVTWEKPAVVEKEEEVEVVAAEAIPVKEEKAEEVVKEEEVKEEKVEEVVKEEKEEVIIAEVIPVKEEKVEEVVKEEKEEVIIAEAIPVKEGKVEDVVKEELKEGVKEIAKPATAKVPQEIIPAEEEVSEVERKEYTGQKISLDFKDADIRNILRLIADISGLNIIVSENVKGKVTIKLENIPWDEVLNIILETNNLGKLWMGSVLRIETQEEIRRISEEKYRAQKSQEKVAELKSVVVDIIYRDANDVMNLLNKEKEISSDRGAISVDPNLNRLVITDTPEKIDNIKEKIARYDDRTVRQVFIEAKIIQSIPTFTKEIGIVWASPYVTQGNSGKTAYAVGGQHGIEFQKEEVTNPITGEVTKVLKDIVSKGNMVDLPAAVGAGSGAGIGFGILRRNFELTATLTAMEKDEKLKIISNPRILSIDKNEAMIKQGVALPYLKLSEEGVTSTEFKDAVLELKVTPTILSEKIIKIEINVKKDQKSAQTGAGGEPGIDVRETRTVLIVESGRTVVIGGIYEETINIIKSGVPFFSDIPGLGRLFTNTYNKKELTELLIFLTTTIVPKDIIGIDSTD